MNLSQYLQKSNCGVYEGHCQQLQEQMNDLSALVSKDKVLRVMEIGFNAGHSAEVFLASNRNIHLTSFDLGEYEIVAKAKTYIDTVYPGRHTLIIGNSVKTIPKFIQDNPGTKFDLIFIDGGHDYEVALADIENCRVLAHDDTVVLLDDTMFDKQHEQEYTIGPTRVWLEQIHTNKITEISRKHYGVGRGMARGTYK